MAKPAVVAQVSHAVVFVHGVWALGRGVFGFGVRLFLLQVSLARPPPPGVSKFLPILMTLRLASLTGVEPIRVGVGGGAVTVSFDVFVMGADGLVPFGADAPEAEDLNLAHLGWLVN